MPIESGTRLGPFEVLSPIGAGGMGEIYKARDTRLDRVVAIKVLPEELAASPERRQRFEREAKAISQLTHPHICTLYDVGEQNGVDFLVMEYIEGETIAERLKRGALPLDQVLEYGIQMTDGLVQAHRLGIVHRDLKPGNLMSTTSGIKLLDFGLAKIFRDRVDSDASDAPTQQRDLTQPQSILGTLQYMAPEQLEAGPVDARTDVWAVGAVLYEMLTGSKAFQGRSQASLIGAILKDEPRALSELLPLSPRALGRVVSKCLRKDPDGRWQTATDLRDELEWIRAADSADESVAVGNVGRQRRLVPVILATAVASILVAFGVESVFRPRALDPAPVKRLSITLPEGQRLAADAGVAISPDGAMVVYPVLLADGRSQLHLRSIDSFESMPLRDTEGGSAPFFSSDGRWVGFHAEAEGELKKIAVSPGASPLTICDAGSVFGATWEPDGIIWFAQYSPPTSGIYRVQASGGTAELMSVSGGWNAPVLGGPLPGGEAVLFADFKGSVDATTVEVLLPETHERKRLGQSGDFPRYLASGHVLFETRDALMAAPFVLDRLEFGGAPFPVLRDLHTWRSGFRRRFDLSEDGTLVYIPSEESNVEGVPLFWVDRNGVATQFRTKEPWDSYAHPRVSPDGRKIVMSRGLDIWVLDVARDTMTRLTFGEGMNFRPVWSHDGARVFFRSDRQDEMFHTFWKPVDGTRQAEPLTRGRESTAPLSASSDGKTLVLQLWSDDGDLDIGTLPLDGNGEPRTLLGSRFNEFGGMLSPDDRWLAYVSDESGRQEVYLYPFRGEGSRVKVSTDGGTEPMWSRNGRELYYRNSNKMLAVRFAEEPELVLGETSVLFEESFQVDTPSAQYSAQYDVADDGRFVMVGASVVTRLHVVLNWLEEVNRLVPPND